MKRLSLTRTFFVTAAVTALLAITPASSFGQAASSAPATTRPLGSGTGGGATGEKAKPLSAADKKFIKDASETVYYELNLIEKAKRNALDKSVSTLGEATNKDLQKIWEEVATLAVARNEKMPTELTGSDKSKADKLGKAEASKFDKEFLKIFTKETKRLAQSFEVASKSAQDAEIKTFAAKWLDAVKGHATGADKTDDELGKKK